MVDVVTRWRGQHFADPTVIVPLPSSTHATLIASVAQRLSAQLRIPIVEAIEVTGRPSDRDLSAKARAAYQEPRIAIAPGTALDGQTVLLVDDRLRTGWTVTLAGALLREAGAARVLPLVVHKQPAT